MKLLIKYFNEDQESKTFEFELDQTFPLSNISKVVSDHIKEDIILLPVKAKNINTIQTINEYCHEYQSSIHNYHFTAVSHKSLNQEEQHILTQFSLNKLLQDKEYNHLQFAQHLIHFLQQYLPEDVQKSLVVRLADKSDMFGETYKDTITAESLEGEARHSIQVHPYPWLTSGASNVIVHCNPYNELLVALVYNQRRDRRPQGDPSRQAGIPDFWKLPEGYMHPKPCKGGEHGISLVSSDDMDEAEELILKNIPMKAAYAAIKEKRKDVIPTQPHSYDNSTKECATRECYEEVGLKFTVEQVQMVAQREENRLIPSVVAVNLIKSTTKDVTPPTLKVDGLEIKEAIWAKVRAFNFETDSKKPENVRVSLDYYDENDDRYSVEIPIKYALMIGQALKKLRDDEIQTKTQFDGFALFNSRENIEARVKQILATSTLNSHQKSFQDILGSPPEYDLRELVIKSLPGETLQEKHENMKALAQLGKNADNYHKKITVLAGAFKKSSLDRALNADQLVAIAKEGPEIESRLLSSKARLFSLTQLHHNPLDQKNINSTPVLAI